MVTYEMNVDKTKDIKIDQIIKYISMRITSINKQLEELIKLRKDSLELGDIDSYEQLNSSVNNLVSIRGELLVIGNALGITYRCVED